MPKKIWGVPTRPDPDTYRPDDELNVSEAAKYLDLSRNTFARIKDRIRHTRLSERVIRFRVADLEAYRLSRTFGGTRAS